MFKVKAGIARVFKAPNLYQSSEGYLLSTRGNGCPNNVSEGSCYLLGNPDLDPEISVNKEIGGLCAGRLRGGHNPVPQRLQKQDRFRNGCAGPDKQRRKYPSVAERRKGCR